MEENDKKMNANEGCCRSTYECLMQENITPMYDFSRSNSNGDTHKSNSIRKYGIKAMFMSIFCKLFNILKQIVK